MKNARQQKILELIEKYDIDTQETLIERLREAGYVVTQTTVSRDIKQLSLVKGVTGRGTYKYVSPGAKPVATAPVLNSAITESIVHIESAENIIVVKTLSGMAQAAATLIDSMEYRGVIGCIAGDDTIMTVAKSEKDANKIADQLRLMLKN